MYHVRVEKPEEVLTEIHLNEYREAWNTYRWHCDHSNQYNTYVVLIRDKEIVEENDCYWKRAEQSNTATIEK